MIYIRNALNIEDFSKRSSLITIGAAAYCGFSELGKEVCMYNDIDKIELTKEDIVVGPIDDMTKAFERFGIKPKSIDYPTELADFFGRDVSTVVSLHSLIEGQKTNIFIKPAQGMKKFTGRVIKTLSDYCGLSFEEDISVICSPVLEILSEWRAYIRYGELITIKNYAGDPFLVPSKSFVYDAIAAYTSAPAAYALDFGVLSDGKSIVIEGNEGYSLGVYGISPIQYARLLGTRYSSIMKVEDCYI